MGTLLSTINYTYGNDAWGDLLTNYNGTNIVYDEIGNPLNWHNVTSMTWTQRRRLSAYTYVENGNTYNVSLSYNTDGIRIGKITVNANDATDISIVSYTVDGASILREDIFEDGSVTSLYYIYDDKGEVIGFKDGDRDSYFYGKNVQGDVIALFNTESELLARYYYDAWGNIISVKDANGTEITDADNIALINPIRYRSYYYDTGTKFYFLNSRYYDPLTCRFINVDGQMSGVNGSLKGYNLFVYCFNNPINMSDENGNWPKFIKNAVKWVAKNVVKPVVKIAQNNLSQVDNTYSQGINVSGTPSAFIFNLQVGISIDTKGNVAIQGSSGGGFTGGSPGASFTAYQSVTNAPSIDKLDGPGYQVGGSVGVPVCGVPLAFGGDFNIIPDSALNTTYFGKTTNVGVGTPGGEFHVEWGETATWNDTRFNIFDVAENIYIKIMEW